MDNSTTMSQLYARFLELAERAEHETKRYDPPYGETQMALDTLNSISDAADSQPADTGGPYERGEAGRSCPP